MKIVIKSERSTALTPTLESIVQKLNKMVGYTEFFAVKDDGIVFLSSSNVDCHTKLVLILGLYINSLHKKFRCYVWFGNHGDYVGKFVLGCLPLETLNNFIDSLGKIEDVKVEIAS